MPSEFDGDDDIKLYLVAAEGARRDAEPIMEAMAATLPYFMLPRYIEFIAALPRTPTSKVKKNILRQSAFASPHWDRKVVGMRLRDLYGSRKAG